ncbi:MAG TPA: NRDE family protein, partial [Candidatus Binatia bacterium]|nr:NRDE family protein [Candidatus Binatia bacterium]
MCTLAIYLRQFEKYPVVIAANRDEHFARPSEAPKLWKGDPAIVAGKDLVAGGTWLGVNSAGIAAAIVNRRLQTEAPAA